MKGFSGGIFIKTHVWCELSKNMVVWLIRDTGLQKVYFHIFFILICTVSTSLLGDYVVMYFDQSRTEEVKHYL